MNSKILIVPGLIGLLSSFIFAGSTGAAGTDPIAVDGSPRLKDMPAPSQPTPEEAATIVASSTTTAPQCFGDGATLTITIPSFDPANPGSQDVVFWRESIGNSANLWIAWDFLTTAYGRQDVITCDQLAYLQGSMDSIVSTDVYYFGDYVRRPRNNRRIDVMIYNIVDESFFDSNFPFYIAGFFWSSLNDAFNRNMIFIDSYDWANRLGANVARPYLYEGVVAHELEHLIHRDHDVDEDSWIDEGMADLAGYLNGFGHPDSHVVYYLAFHRTPLTVWGGGLENYGASYLFQLYLLENFGSKGSAYPTGWKNTWTRNLIDQQANSIAGVEAATGANFDTLYDAWILANYLDDPSQDGAGGYPIGYNEINLTPFVSGSFSPWSIERAITDIYGAGHQGALPIDRYYGGYISGTVEFPLGAVSPYTPVYGLYSGFEPSMSIYLRGEAASGVAPYAGTYEVASGGGHLVTDRIMTLNVPAGGTLTFWTWFDIEKEWDFGFVEASTGGGAWTPLQGTITRCSNNPNNSTAWANSPVGGQTSSCAVITGSSGGWVQASFTLPAGSNVMVRFSYYTDEAVNGQGWFIDEVNASGAFGTFYDGFEAGTGNWSLGGWTWTTGLFDNDWLAAFVNPVYRRGKFHHLEYGYFDNNTIGGNFETESGFVDTSQLGNDQATVIFTNRPRENPFAGGYLLLVDKGDASG